RPAHAELARLFGGNDASRDLPPRHVGALFGALVRDSALGGIVVDDLQWADEATLDVLREARAREHSTQLRWSFASRLAEDETAADRIARVQRDYAAETIALEPLDASMLQRLVASLAIGTTGSGEPARRLLAKVGGNPLFVLELLRQVHSAGGDWDRIL